VNDALVSMLGYDSRDELLQVDIPSQVYFSPEQRQFHSSAMEENGVLRNFEATLRRKGRLADLCPDQCFRDVRRRDRLLQIRGLMLDVTGLHTYQSELQRERDFSGKNSQQHPELYFGFRYRRPHQLCEPPLVRRRV